MNNSRSAQTNPYEPPKVPMLKFTIREITLVTVIVAIVLAWWVDRYRLRSEYWALVEEVRMVGFDVLETEAGVLVTDEYNPPVRDRDRDHRLYRIYGSP